MQVGPGQGQSPGLDLILPGGSKWCYLFGWCGAGRGSCLLLLGFILLWLFSFDKRSPPSSLLPVFCGVRGELCGEWMRQCWLMADLMA